MLVKIHVFSFQKLRILSLWKKAVKNGKFETKLQFLCLYLIAPPVLAFTEACLAIIEKQKKYSRAMTVRKAQ